MSLPEDESSKQWEAALALVQQSCDAWMLGYQTVRTAYITSTISGELTATVSVTSTEYETETRSAGVEALRDGIVSAGFYILGDEDLDPESSTLNIQLFISLLPDSRRSQRERPAG